jgi:hypothetical protein
MTELQKQVITGLIGGGTIAAYGNNFRLRDAKCNPVIRFTYKTFKPIKEFLRRKDDVYVLDKVAIRKMRKNSWIKKTYLTKHHEKKVSTAG